MMEFQQVELTATIHHAGGGWYVSVEQRGVRVVSGPFDTLEVAAALLARTCDRGAGSLKEGQPTETEAPRD